MKVFLQLAATHILHACAYGCCFCLCVVCCGIFSQVVDSSLSKRRTLEEVLMVLRVESYHHLRFFETMHNHQHITFVLL